MWRCASHRTPKTPAVIEETGAIARARNLSAHLPTLVAILAETLLCPSPATKLKFTLTYCPRKRRNPRRSRQLPGCDSVDASTLSLRSCLIGGSCLAGSNLKFLNRSSLREKIVTSEINVIRFIRFTRYASTERVHRARAGFAAPSVSNQKG